MDGWMLQAGRWVHPCGGRVLVESNRIKEVWRLGDWQVCGRCPLVFVSVSEEVDDAAMVMAMVMGSTESE